MNYKTCSSYEFFFEQINKCSKVDTMGYLISDYREAFSSNHLQCTLGNKCTDHLQSFVRPFIVSSSLVDLAI